MSVSLQPVTLINNGDNEGLLVFFSERLVAVLARLSAEHGDKAGHWFLECGFGALSRCDAEFDDLEEAESWIEARLAAN